MAFGRQGRGGAAGLGMEGLRLRWVIAELRLRGLLPDVDETPDDLELLDRTVRGVPLTGAHRRRRVDVPSTESDGKQQLTVRQVARRLAVCEKTVRRMMGDCDLPFTRVRGAVRVEARDVDRWVSARKEGR